MLAMNEGSGGARSMIAEGVDPELNIQLALGAYGRPDGACMESTQRFLVISSVVAMPDRWHRNRPS